MPLTEAEILEEAIDGLPPGDASAILKLRFKDSAEARIRELLQQNNQSDLSASDHADLEKYLRVGLFLDLLQAKARLSLGSVTNPAKSGVREDLSNEQKS